MSILDKTERASFTDKHYTVNLSGCSRFRAARLRATYSGAERRKYNLYVHGVCQVDTAQNSTLLHSYVLNK